MKSVVTFLDDRFPVPQVETIETEGRELALAVYASLSEGDIRLEQMSPIEGEGGWSVFIATGSRSWRLFLNAAGIGEPIVDFWAISISPRKRGLRELLLGVRSTEEELREASSCLEQALERMGVENERWWDLDEFTAETLGSEQ